MDPRPDLEAFWHTSSHILAQAVKRLHPEVKLGTGPAIEQGFYYDFFLARPFTPDDLGRIEEEMRTIVAADLPVEHLLLDRNEAQSLLKDEPFKREIFDALSDEKISFYRQGDFADLCAGPHLASTGVVRHFKLLSVAASCWRGDENRESMQRIYGISFPKEKELKEYVTFLEEAKQRDHRTLGTKLDLFSIHPEIGSGLIFWHPKGAAIRRTIEDFWRDAHLKNGYQLLFTPHVADISLWEQSGHTSFYTPYMFPRMTMENERQYQLKPMNCPFHILIYKNKLHSYRELPIRWAELGTVYRMEKQGVLHGLLRVRGFTQDDAHIFCTPMQLQGEIERILDFTFFFLGSFGFSSYRIFLSTRPEKFVGSSDHWEKATLTLESALKQRGIPYEIDPGEGVFYGPKIDIKIKDCLGREWQCTTIQVDFNLPERFGMVYTDESGKDAVPIMIHRAILGSLERFFGILIEHYKGNLPLWLSPVQVAVLPIADRHLSYAGGVKDLLGGEFRVTVDERGEKINRKIRDAEEEKIPCMLIIGDKEMEAKTVSVRRHGRGTIGTMTPEELRGMLRDEVEHRK